MSATRGLAALCSTLGFVLGFAAVVSADEVGQKLVRLEPEAPVKLRPGKQLEEEPLYGVYYDRREPSFYTGFAPRSQDPNRVHLQVGRGNQLRITAVLSEEVISGYARDLLTRRQTYRDLIAKRRVVLTQNTGFEEFENTTEEIDLEELVADEVKLSPSELMERNLELMERLNPGRIFRVDIPVDQLVRRWASHLRPVDREKLSRDRELELVNLMLPTRLWIAKLSPQNKRALRELIAVTPQGETLDPDALDELRPRFLAFFQKMSKGLYPERDGSIRFVEFTAIHPIGTFNDYTDFNGEKIPLYPTPGRRALTTHQRTQTVDHIPTKLSYSYFPWLPYMHVGDTLHNSFHTLWWPMPANGPEFLPPEWQGVDRGSRDGEPFENLWLLSRGPMSSGCTHLNAGHISELRQLMPSDTQKLYEIDVFLNRSYDYDVFDIDGDLEPEVMGVKYYIAYSLRNKRPNRLRARNERHAFYKWLYAGSDIRFDPNTDRVWFAKVQDGRFVERTAKKGRIYRDLPLYEAEYQPERIQFYRPRSIEFVRELRKVALEHPFDGMPPSRSPAE